MLRSFLRPALINPQFRYSLSRKCFSTIPRPFIDPHTQKPYPTSSLILEDGTMLQCQSFGSFESCAGEIVFSTAMSGYVESLTDPSYSGQILVTTFPMVGNYGVPAFELDEYGLNKYFESNKIHARGLIVSEYCQHESHWQSTRSLSQWLKEQNIPALFGVDTRALTQRIRDQTKGIRDTSSLLAKIVADKDVEFVDPNMMNLVENVSTQNVKTYNPGGRYKILLLDMGCKHSIIRRLCERGAAVTVVPWNANISELIKNYDGLMISNGPGDPRTPIATLKQLEIVLGMKNPKPIFGICLGHQLVATAVGANTYKMRYGHRGLNQPCIDLTDQRCYITSQNHGYAVDAQSLHGGEWEPYFLNANDGTNEGLRHSRKPIFTVQFHPEGRAGPEDTSFLFDRFLALVEEYKLSGKTTPLVKKPRKKIDIEDNETEKLSIGKLLTKGKPLPISSVTEEISHESSKPIEHPHHSTKVNKVLVLGSGGLQIGQAGEFDYSGSQAIKALKESNIESILINPNIATVQTAKGLADKVYFLPVTPEFVESVIEKEKPDGIFLQFGGQTALNCGIELDKRGILKKHSVRVLGTSVSSIIATEDRDIFKQKLIEINQPVAKSLAVNTVDDALKAANDVGYPVIARAAFSLGGLGSGFANNDEELRNLCIKAFSASPQVLIERSMRGWKEVEYEVVRDQFDNCITVCNMENFDPLGIHTGDSIVVAPSQTLSDIEYQMLRKAAIDIVRHLGIVGECNVQYALNPTSLEYVVIECNPRLSRSSALASKATGYPLAAVAARLALGSSLPEIRNAITEVTSACFEPSLDYIVCKFPKWNFEKFKNANRRLGSGMKSVGEVMSIGRNFEEAFQKAMRMVNGCSSILGFEHGNKEAVLSLTDSQLKYELQHPSDLRIFQIALAFERGLTVDQIHQLTKIDKWFLHKLQNIHLTNFAFSQVPVNSANQIPIELLRIAKQSGFSDEQISRCLSNKQIGAADIRNYRFENGLVPFTKQIDTLASEFKAQTNYLYMTYHANTSDITPNSNGIVVLGSGNYSIGTSVEFDCTSVSTIRTLREVGKTAIVVNYNPETVSTDYDESDRLYFEELTLERVLDICDQESPEGVIVSVGGQIPNNLVMKLHSNHISILGTKPENIDKAEDRSKFSAIMDSIGIKQPEWAALSSLEEASKFAERVGYPVLVRPSYVLSGAAMKVVRSPSQLKDFLIQAHEVNKAHPVVISKFIQNAKEVDFDGVSQNGELIAFAVSEHIEKAGTHSGDATLVLPAQSLTKIQNDAVVQAARKIIRALNIHGPCNMQFIVKDDEVSVIETNIRASRSFPFVSKVLDVDFIKLATRIMLGGSSSEVRLPNGEKHRITNLAYEIDNEETAIDLNRLNFVAVKSPQFSFARLGGADPSTGVEMASTGEVACYAPTIEEAFLKSLMASNIKLPQKRILLMLGDEENREEFKDSMIKLNEMGYELYALPGSASYLSQNDIPHTEVSLDQTRSGISVQELMAKKFVDLVFAFPCNNGTVKNVLSDEAQEMEQLYTIRRQAVDFNLPICKNVQVANMLVKALSTVEELTVQAADEVTHAIKP